MQSQANSLNTQDWKKWARNGLIFLAPALLVLLSSIQTALPDLFKNSAYAAIFIFVAERGIDLARKYLNGSK